MSLHASTPTGAEHRGATLSAAPGAVVPAKKQTDTSTEYEPTHQLVDFDRYIISHNGPVGYVEVVPPVFVCYVGHPFARAEEVAQVHDFGRAVGIVSERAAASQRLGLAP